ncbi:MAG TPA: hypothetical protein VNT56_12310, partial [Acidimicrobiales bacterium]|nr:hypothetical protein [Acidimicrobiales bacterium]
LGAGGATGSEPGCTTSEIGVDGLGRVRTAAGEPTPGQSRRPAEGPGGDDRDAMVTLGQVFADEASGGELPPMDLDVGVQLGQLDVDLAVDAEAAPGGGVNLGAGVTHGASEPGGCGRTGGIELGAGPLSP